MKRCSECGRPAKALPSHGKKRSRRARAGKPVAIKNHDLCPGCFRKLRDSFFASQFEPTENDHETNTPHNGSVDGNDIGHHLVVVASASHISIEETQLQIGAA